MSLHQSGRHRRPSERPRRGATPLAAIAAATAVLGVLSSGSATALAAPSPSAVPTAATAVGRDAPAVQELGERWAAGDGAGAAEVIVSAGYTGDAVALGHALADADGRVLDAGSTADRVDRFAEAVDAAYRAAEVSPAVASASFAVGLADVLADYGSMPSDPLVWGPAQADIGSSILLRAIPRWVAPPAGAPTSPSV